MSHEITWERGCARGHVTSGEMRAPSVGYLELSPEAGGPLPGEVFVGRGRGRMALTVQPQSSRLVFVNCRGNGQRQRVGDYYHYSLLPTKKKTAGHFTRTGDGSAVTFLVAVRRPVAERGANLAVDGVHRPLAVVVIYARTTCIYLAIPSTATRRGGGEKPPTEYSYRCYGCDGSCSGTCRKCTSNVTAALVGCNRPALVPPR